MRIFKHSFLILLLGIMIEASLTEKRGLSSIFHSIGSAAKGASSMAKGAFGSGKGSSSSASAGAKPPKHLPAAPPPPPPKKPVPPPELPKPPPPPPPPPPPKKPVPPPELPKSPPPPPPSPTPDLPPKVELPAVKPPDPKPTPPLEKSPPSKPSPPKDPPKPESPPKDSPKTSTLLPAPKPSSTPPLKPTSSPKIPTTSPKPSLSSSSPKESKTSVDLPKSSAPSILKPSTSSNISKSQITSSSHSTSLPKSLTSTNTPPVSSGVVNGASHNSQTGSLSGSQALKSTDTGMHSKTSSLPPLLDVSGSKLKSSLSEHPNPSSSNFDSPNRGKGSISAAKTMSATESSGLKTKQISFPGPISNGHSTTQTGSGILSSASGSGNMIGSKATISETGTKPKATANGMTSLDDLDIGSASPACAYVPGKNRPQGKRGAPDPCDPVISDPEEQGFGVSSALKSSSVIGANIPIKSTASGSVVKGSKETGIGMSSGPFDLPLSGTKFTSNIPRPTGSQLSGLHSSVESGSQTVPGTHSTGLVPEATGGLTGSVLSDAPSPGAKSHSKDNNSQSTHLPSPNASLAPSQALPNNDYYNSPDESSTDKTPPKEPDSEPESGSPPASGSELATGNKIPWWQIAGNALANNHRPRPSYDQSGGYGSTDQYSSDSTYGNSNTYPQSDSAQGYDQTASTDPGYPQEPNDNTQLQSDPSQGYEQGNAADQTYSSDKNPENNQQTTDQSLPTNQTATSDQATSPEGVNGDLVGAVNETLATSDTVATNGTAPVDGTVNLNETVVTGANDTAPIEGNTGTADLSGEHGNATTNGDGAAVDGMDQNLKSPLGVGDNSPAYDANPTPDNTNPPPYSENTQLSGQSGNPNSLSSENVVTGGNLQAYQEDGAQNYPPANPGIQGKGSSESVQQNGTAQPSNDQASGTASQNTEGAYDDQQQPPAYSENADTSYQTQSNQEYTVAGTSNGQQQPTAVPSRAVTNQIPQDQLYQANRRDIDDIPVPDIPGNPLPRSLPPDFMVSSPTAAHTAGQTDPPKINEARRYREDYNYSSLRPWYACRRELRETYVHTMTVTVGY